MAETDRELMVLVAKAIGGVLSEGHTKVRTGETWDDWEWQGPKGIVTGPGWLTHPGVVIHPLINNDNALQLAVMLGISITPYPIYNSDERHAVVAKQRRRSDTYREANPTEVIELYGDDPAAAWRLAIVRCAAEIGRAM